MDKSKKTLVQRSQKSSRAQDAAPRGGGGLMDMEIRKLEANDLARLEAFFRVIPEDDRTFVKEELNDPETVRSIVSDRRGLRFVAVDPDGAFAGYAAVLPATGLSHHVGEVRLVIAPSRRRSGIGKALARRALVAAVRELSLRKLFVEVVAEQDAAIQMFRQLGFVGEAILRDHLCDRSGAMRDLIVLSHFVEENWNAIRGLGLDREL